MLKHFTGFHDHKVDLKGRVSLPTEFRRVLDQMESADALYIVPNYDDPRAHAGFTKNGYAKLVERHNGYAYKSRKAQQRMTWRLVTNARQIQIDNAGRIVLPTELRDPLGITDLVRFVGAADTFEIWEPKAHIVFTQELFEDEDEDEILDRRGLH